MIKVVFCLRRLPALTLAEFQDYWLNSHGALVRELQDALRIKRYVQLHSDLGELTRRLGAFRGAPEPFDGIAEVWYENRAALETLRQNPAGRAASETVKVWNLHSLRTGARLRSQPAGRWPAGCLQPGE